MKGGAAEEFAEVVNFVRRFSPSKLVIDGHTDSDASLNLSLLCAQNIKNWLVNEFEFIAAQMVDARGFGEEQPVINNDTPENKQLNRRIEVLVWK